MDTNSTGITQRTSRRFMPPEELSMQMLTKQLYKNHVFRGFYAERCFFQQIGDYRDVIALERGEHELEKMLIKSAAQLQIFYQQNVPNMWIGINSMARKKYQNQLQTCLLTEMNDLAFGEYWFCIRTLRFRDDEVQFKIKMVRPVEPQESSLSRHSLPPLKNKSWSTPAGGNEQLQESAKTISQPEVGVSDFVALLRNWGNSIKQSTFYFLSNVNKNDIVDVIRFLGLLLVGFVGGLLISLRYMGIFALRFLYELSRFTHTATPIVFKLIDFISKLVGGVFILITMIWKDLVVNRGGRRGVQENPLDENRRFNRLANDQEQRCRSIHYKSIGNFQ